MRSEVDVRERRKMREIQVWGKRRQRFINRMGAGVREFYVEVGWGYLYVCCQVQALTSSTTNKLSVPAAGRTHAPRTRSRRYIRLGLGHAPGP